MTAHTFRLCGASLRVAMSPRLGRGVLLHGSNSMARLRLTISGLRVVFEWWFGTHGATMLPDEPRRSVRRPANGTVNYGTLISEAVMRHEVAARMTNSAKRLCLHDRCQMDEVQKYGGSKQQSEFSAALNSRLQRVATTALSSRTARRHWRLGARRPCDAIFEQPVTLRRSASHPSSRAKIA